MDLHREHYAPPPVFSVRRRVRPTTWLVTLVALQIVVLLIVALRRDEAAVVRAEHAFRIGMATGRADAQEAARTLTNDAYVRGRADQARICTEDRP